MSDGELNLIRAQQGDIREDIGEIRADVRHIHHTLTTMDARIEERHRDNLAATCRQDAALAKMSERLAVYNGETFAKSRIGSHVWTASYTVIAGIIGALATWFMGGGSGAAHP